MKVFDFFDMIVRAPDGAGGGAGAPPADPPAADAGAGGGADAGAGAGDPGAGAGAGAGEPPTGAGDPPPAGAAPTGKWWEDKRFSEDQRQTLTATGLTVDDPLDAVAKLADMERAAQKRLGAGPENLIEKPKEGQSATEWLREHGDMFGIPDAPENYEIARPEAWPEDAPWDDALEAKARQIAFEEGMPAGALNKMVELFAGVQAERLETAESDLKKAQSEMMAALEQDWGDQTEAKLAQARQALGVIAEQAGLDQTAQFNLLSTLGREAGDANAWKLFSTLADMMGEDNGLGLMNGPKGMGMTPAEARQKITQMQSPDSAYSKAMQAARSGGPREEFDRLHKEFLALTKIAAS